VFFPPRKETKIDISTIRKDKSFSATPRGNEESDSDVLGRKRGGKRSWERRRCPYGSFSGTSPESSEEKDSTLCPQRIFARLARGKGKSARCGKKRVQRDGGAHEGEGARFGCSLVKGGEGGPAHQRKKGRSKQLQRSKGPMHLPYLDDRIPEARRTAQAKKEKKKKRLSTQQRKVIWRYFGLNWPMNRGERKVLENGKRRSGTKTIFLILAAWGIRGTLRKGKSPERKKKRPQFPLRGRTKAFVRRERRGEHYLGLFQQGTSSTGKKCRQYHRGGFPVLCGGSS